MTGTDDAGAEDRRATDEEKRYPGVALAYELIVPSQQWLQQRLDAVDSRIQTLLVFAVTITFGAPVFASALVRGISVASPWFVVAVITFVIVVVGGIVTRAWGTLGVIAPKKLYDSWLHLEPWEFKKNLLSFTAKSFEQDKGLVNAKGWIAVGMSVLLILEAVFLVVWVLAERQGMVSSGPVGHHRP